MPADWLSARASSANGERGLVGVREPFHPLELARPGRVDDRGGDDLVRRVQAEQLHPEAAQHVGGEMAWAGDADGARVRQHLDERHVVDELVPGAQLVDLAGVARDAPLSVDCCTVLRLRARPTPRRRARKFQCSGRRVQSIGPSRIACS